MGDVSTKVLHGYSNYHAPIPPPFSGDRRGGQACSARATATSYVLDSG